MSQPASKAGFLNEFLSPIGISRRLRNWLGLVLVVFALHRSGAGPAEIPSTQACGKRLQLLTRRLTEDTAGQGATHRNGFQLCKLTATALPCSHCCSLGSASHLVPWVVPAICSNSRVSLPLNKNLEKIGIHNTKRSIQLFF